MKRSLLLLIPALAMTFIFSCKKDDDGQHNSVTNGSFRSLDEALYASAPVSRSTSIIVPTGGRLTAPGGTVFIFPPNAFETLTGGKVTGSVEVTIQDWLQKGDMIYGKVLPLSYGKPLQSAGEAYVAVTQNGVPLHVRKGVHVMVLFPQFGGNTPIMTGWVGRTLPGGANTVNWLEDTTALKTNILVDTISLSADTLHYIQAAVPLEFGSTYSTFTVPLNSPVALESSMAVALYDGIKAVFPLPAPRDGKINAVGVPSSAMHIAVMGIAGGKFYGGIVAVPSPKSDSIYPVTIMAVEPPTFKLQLNSL